jgi:UDP-N-acetylmuramoyl-L-alanyl-D-glutamate--2,6-diaminopimelate ligase
MLKTLQDILSGVSVEKTIGEINVPIKHIRFDSRDVSQQDLFVAVPGTQVDGHHYIDKAIEKGAVAIVCEHLPEHLKSGVTYVKVSHAARALGKMASAYYDHPSEKLKVVGVTGTNGKTTIVTLLHQLFLKLGYKAGMLSTIVNKINHREIKSTHTTPDAVHIQQILNDMVEAGCDYVFMEVSSHAIVQERIAGLQFAGGVFTNITHDHLDYHKTFKEYIFAKKRFFDLLPEKAFALVNADDRHAKVMIQNTKARKYTYGIRSMADFHARVLENRFSGLEMIINEKPFFSLLTGIFNASNLLAVYAVAVLLEQDRDEVLQVLSSLKGAEGRFDILTSPDQVICIVDYAHTPDALKNVLTTIQDIRSGNEQLITVVGAGGNRDKTKRPEMAAIAASLSNRVILTSDNPRNEDPEIILQDMKAGIDPVHKKNTLVIADRKEAIKTAYALAAPGDIILIAGKGHEKYQEIKGVRHPFDDKQVLLEIFETR